MGFLDPLLKLFGMGKEESAESGGEAGAPTEAPPAESAAPEEPAAPAEDENKQQPPAQGV